MTALIPILTPTMTALAAAALLLTPAVTTTSSSRVLLQSASLPTLAEPRARAADLDLPEPAAQAGPTASNCAIDVGLVFPVACFPTRTDVASYLRGESGRADDERDVHQLVLSGYGGTAASTSGVELLGKTCASTACSSGTVTWYSSSGSVCTHAYPNNDYFAENLTTFTYAENYGRGTSSLNCNRMILYRDGTQGGAGALDCGSAAACGGTSTTYRSVSWHNG
jgi:hypothetical protein